MEVSFCSGRCHITLVNESGFVSCDAHTHPWVCYDAGRLHLNHFLNELDATYLDPSSTAVPPLQYIRFDSSHIVPDWHIDWILNTASKSNIRHDSLKRSDDLEVSTHGQAPSDYRARSKGLDIHVLEYQPVDAGASLYHALQNIRIFSARDF